MFLRLANRCLFAMIRANKINKEVQVTAQALNKCREIIGLKNCEKTTIQQKMRSYFQDRVYGKDNLLNRNAVYQNWSSYHLIETQINILQFRQKMGKAQSEYLYKIFLFWGRFILSENNKVYKQSQRVKQQYRAILHEYFVKINSVCYLIQLDENMISIYLKIYSAARSQQKEDKYYSHLRYVFDHIVALKKIDKHFLGQLLYFTGKYNPIIFYHKKDTEINHLIYKSISKDNLEKENKRFIKNLAINISTQTIITDQMKQIALNLYQKLQDPLQKLTFFRTLIEIFTLHKDNIKEHIQTIQYFIKQCPKQAFKQLSIIFCYADIWVSQFWLPYFQFAGHQKNYEHVLVDDTLINLNVGGPQLNKKANEFRAYLLSNGIDMGSYDVRKEYEKKFGRIVQHHTSFQTHIANSMRLVCGAQIVSEVAVKYFIVDILIDNDVIVEINNPSHYKTVDGKLTLNLKSQFRRRVLSLSGYKCYNIHLCDYYSEEINMMQEIHNIVESTGKRRKDVKRLGEGKVN